LHFDNGDIAVYWGQGPFYFGLQIRVADWNKNPWAVDRKFTTKVNVRRATSSGPLSQATI
jgi:hypothetical protein